MEKQISSLIEGEQKYALLVKRLNEYFYIVFFGGVVRDILWKMSDTIRDIDIVLIPRYNYVYAKEKYVLKNVINEHSEILPIGYNQFGGYKIKGNKYGMDVWLLDDTWAFRNGILPASATNLLNSVYLNIDSYAFNYSECCFVKNCDKKSYDEIDILLEKSKCEELNIIRAIVFSEKYNMPISNRLREKIKKLLTKWNELEKFLYFIQDKHYGRVLVDKREIEKVLRRN